LKSAQFARISANLRAFLFDGLAGLILDETPASAAIP
jgi:hypothetical protein